MTRKVTLLPNSPAGARLPLGVEPERCAVAIDNLVYTGAVTGLDPQTGVLPSDPARQFELAFHNLEALLDKAGLSWSEVGLVTVFIPGSDYRQYINPPWLVAFPDEDDRPARKTNHVNLPDGVFVQLQAAAVAGERRQRLEIPGLSHRDPLPMGCRIGDMVFSSVIVAQDPADGKPVSGNLEQIHRCFDNTKILMDQAGGSLADVAHMWVFLSNFDYQSPMVDIWVETWPQDGDRPSRKTLRYPLGGDSLIQVQVTGVLGGKRTNHEIPGVHHHDPIPMGARIGRVFYSSGVSASDPKGDGLAPVSGGLEPQIQQCHANIEALMASAGSSLADIALVTVLVHDFAVVPVVRRYWEQLYPDPLDRPALNFVDWRIPGGNLVQYHVVGVMP